MSLCHFVISLPLGIQGLQGVPGSRGEKGDTGAQGPQGPKGMAGPQGITGEKGNIGVQTPVGNLSGPVGAIGDLEKMLAKTAGTVYVRWGHDECPSSATLVYTGRAGGSRFNERGGGSNPQCLPLKPTYLLRSNEKDDIYTARMYGGEYQLYRVIGKASHQNDVPCAVCYANRSAQFMLPAQHTCPGNWTTEYHGYLMAARHDHHRSQFTCVDKAFKSVPGSSANQDGYLFYLVEGRCGTLPCPPYDETSELTCAVCTK